MGGAPYTADAFSEWRASSTATLHPMRVAGIAMSAHRCGALGRARNQPEDAMIKKKGMPGDDSFEIPDDEVDEFGDEEEGDEDDLLDDEEFDEEFDDDEEDDELSDEFDEETYDEDED